MDPKNNTSIISLKEQCFIKFDQDWDDNLFFLFYYIISLLVQLLTIGLLIYRRKYKTLTAKLFIVFFVANCSLLVNFIFTALMDDKKVAGSRCSFIKINYSFHSIITKISVASLMVIMKSNILKIKGIRKIETPEEKKRQNRKNIGTFMTLVLLSTVEPVLAMSLESMIMIVLGLLFAITMNIWSLVLAYKAYKVNVYETSTVSLTSSSRRTMVTVKDLQKTTLLLTALTSIPMLLHIAMYFVVSRMTSKSTKKILMYIGRTYIFTLSIKAAVFLYNHKRDILRRRVQNSEMSTTVTNGNSLRMVPQKFEMKNIGDSDSCSISEQKNSSPDKGNTIAIPGSSKIVEEIPHESNES